MKKMKPKISFRRLLCVAVILAILLGVTGCVRQPDAATNGTTTAGTTGSTSTTASTTSTDSTSSTTGTQPSDPSDELEYVLTDADVEAFYELLEECESLSIAGQDLDAIDAVSASLEELFDFLDAQCSIATILHYSHTKDATLEKQYLDCVEVCTQASDAYLQMVRRVYLSDTPAKDYLFGDWTDGEIADLLAYDEQIAKLQQRNAEIGVDYRTSEDDDYKIQLYIEFVGNNNAIARFYGYDNYYTYAYRDVYARDYDENAVAQMRRYAKDYLLECCDLAFLGFYESFSSLGSFGQLAVQNFLYNDYDTLSKDYVQLYLDVLPQQMQDALTQMLEKDSLFTDADDAMPGAFTTAIGDRSYCFFGPGYATSMTVVHEGGHYYASRYMDINIVPLDLAEVHSQGNEWLFLSFLRDHMATNRHDALVDYLLYENIAMILICLMVDEFEQIVYSTDLTGFTAADLDAIMDAVALQYFPNGDVDEVLADMNFYWRAVCVEQPVYYISYAVSSVAAISLYTIATSDFDQAMENYRKLCQEATLEDGFLGNLLNAGLVSPFDEAFYRQLYAMVAA